MRFLAGWFGGPALAIGGATMGDVRRPPPRHVSADD